ncbi:hypothetical protein BSU01_14500 [Erwinia billingiae]|nr:hypothetical protein [Erwinia billingiae]
MYKNSSSMYKIMVLISIFVISFIVIVSRRPDLIFNAQPWAEDGAVWMKNINNDGFWSTILYPQNGYYQTISRITYGIALMFGIAKSALIANSIAISVRCFFVAFILSNRFSFIPLAYRLMAIVYFLLMPNLTEGYVNITNVHWYLSLYLMAILIAEEPESSPWKAHDFIVMIISALSGPFIIFIAPCLFLKRAYQRGSIGNAIRGFNSFDCVMLVCFTIQLVAILVSSGSGRSSAPLGANFDLLASIISYRVIAGTFLSNEMVSSLANEKIVSIVLFISLALIIIYSFIKSSWRVKISIIFPVIMIGFALAKPMMSLKSPQWPVFLLGAGERYFFITNFALACFVLLGISKVKNYSNLLLGVYAIAFISVSFSYYRLKPMDDVGFKEDIQKFSELKKGEKMDIHVNPRGWKMTLIKN